MKESKKVIRVWMARDVDGSLWLYFGPKPQRIEEDGNYAGRSFLLWEKTMWDSGNTDYPEVTNEGGPVEVEVLITILKK